MTPGSSRPANSVAVGCPRGFADICDLARIAMAVHSKMPLVANFVVASIVIGVTGAQPAEVRLIGSAAVKNAVVAAKSVAYSSGPSGFYLADLFKRMGITDQIKDKVKQTPSGVQVGEVVARGEADLGFPQVSELLHLKGIHYLGPLPADIQHVTVFSAGLHRAAPQFEAELSRADLE